MKSLQQIKGFTLVELIIVIGVFMLIAGSSTIVFGNVLSKNALKYYGYQLVQDLREARTSAVAQNGDSSWGVYFNDSSLLHGYTFFKGNNHATRDTSFDRIVEFPKVLRFTRISFGGLKELVFSLSEGSPNGSGYMILTADSKDYTISINAFGLVEYES